MKLQQENTTLAKLNFVSGTTSNLGAVIVNMFMRVRSSKALLWVAQLVSIILHTFQHQFNEK